MTDVGDEMCCRQVWDVGDKMNLMSGAKQIDHQYRISFYNDVADRLKFHHHAEDCHRHTFLSPASENGRQHNDITNITVTHRQDALYPKAYL